MDVMPDGKINPTDRVEAIWCVDNETGKKYLIDLITGKILGDENDITRENGKREERI